ncbi:MAG: ATP-dependent RecD-like DNA helicase [Clostridia bacterium]
MEKIEAWIEEVVFRNEENGFTVLQVKIGRQHASAVGVMPMVASGEQVILTGEWGEHAQYGKQVKVSSLETVRPTTQVGMERYLASGLIRGIGPATARTLVHAFGLDTLDTLQFHPEKLLEIPGIGPKRMQMIAESFAQQQQMREAMVFLQAYGVSPTLAMRIFKAYGERAQAVIRDNPYRLVTDVEGVGFKTADQIAASLGIMPESEFRLAAGVQYALSEASAGKGHTYLPRDLLIEQASGLLRVDPALITHALDQLLFAQELIAQQMPEHVAVYLPACYKAEGEVARRLHELLTAAPHSPEETAEKEIRRFEKAQRIDFSPLQQQAVLSAVREGMTVITGGPGTGKTTIINCIIRLLSTKGNVLLAAPTGRAAKRMTEATGSEAKTIHRLLEYGGEEGNFQRNAENPLETDTLIVDEMSMVDIFLMRNLLRALEPGTRLILVGDADQLPSVGAGNVLGDILSSGMVPTVRLTDIFRQDEHSMIVVNAHRINHGETPYLNSRGSDFFLERRTSHEQTAQTIAALCQTRLPHFLGIDPVRQIQVLSPMKKGECGVYALNALLQARFNPHREDVAERIYGEIIFRVGDKVMQTRNDYQMEWTRGDEEGTGVFNGDMGFITAMDTEERTITVLFDDEREAIYETAALEDLELAYCISVHKSQGSEFPVVVMPVVGGPPMLLTRNLLYTAVTRARRMVVLVGREEAVHAMVRNVDITSRYSALATRLRGLTGD